MRGNDLCVRNGPILCSPGRDGGPGRCRIASALKLTTTTVRAGNLQVTFGGGLHQRSCEAQVRSVQAHDLRNDQDHRRGNLGISGTGPRCRQGRQDQHQGFPDLQGRTSSRRGTPNPPSACAARRLLAAAPPHAEIAFPEQAPIKVLSPLLVFNGGESGGKVTLLAHTFLTVPVPAAIVTTVTVQRKGTGVHAIAKIPVIAGGSGSAVDFKFTLGKTYRYKHKQVGYFEARCPDGVFKVRSKRALFKNETRTPGVAAQTVLTGSVGVPCIGKG